MGFHFMCVPGVEADDVIATLSRCADENKLKTIIASGDKDLMQLVSDNITQLNMKGDLYDQAGVVEKMGVRPDQILDLLALTGDSADNIPGVPSVGPKTAIKWLDKFGGIEDIKTNADQINGKVGEKLRDSFELLDLSYQLVQLKFDVDLPCDILTDEPGPDNAKLASLFQQYGFSMWLKQLNTTNESPASKSVVQATTEPLVNVVENVPSNDFMADYSQTLGTPGILSALSPVNANKSKIWSGRTPIFSTTPD